MSGILETIKNRLLSVVLFSPGPFYFFPPKAGLNRLFGADYETSYYHFREGHRNGVNISLHVICFFVQIMGNFALLNAIDKNMEKIPGVRVSSIISAAVWSLVQLTSPAPKLVSVLSSLCIAAAYFTAPFITPQLMDTVSISSFLVTLVLSNIATGAKIVGVKDMAKAFTILIGILGASEYAQASSFYLSKQSQSKEVLLATLGYLVALPLLLRNPLKPLVISSVFVCRAAYYLTGNPILFYLGYAFLGSLMQGITHSVAHEEATLIALERKGDSAKIASEYGHVTFFPSLAVHSVVDTLRGVKPPGPPKSETSPRTSGKKEE